MPKHFYLFETKKYIPKQNSVKKTNIQTKKHRHPQQQKFNNFIMIN